MAAEEEARKMNEAMRWYVVDIETEGIGLGEASDEAMDRLREAIDRRTAKGVSADAPEAEILAELDPSRIWAPVIAWGGIAGGPSVRASVYAASDDEAADLARRAFSEALEEAGLGSRAVARINVMTEEYQDAWLEQEPEELVGVAEIAETLGVSRQRVSELKGRRGFPRPVAELAAGPVWRLSSLQRFIAQWPRLPGRPGSVDERWERLRALAPRSGDEEVVGARALTDREKEVLALIGSGRSMTEVARALGVQPKTVKAHVRALLAKTVSDPARSTAG